MPGSPDQGETASLQFRSPAKGVPQQLPLKLVNNMIGHAAGGAEAMQRVALGVVTNRMPEDEQPQAAYRPNPADNKRKAEGQCDEEDEERLHHHHHHHHHHHQEIRGSTAMLERITGKDRPKTTVGDNAINEACKVLNLIDQPFRFVITNREYVRKQLLKEGRHADQAAVEARLCVLAATTGIPAKVDFRRLPPDVRGQCDEELCDGRTVHVCAHCGKLSPTLAHARRHTSPPTTRTRGNKETAPCPGKYVQAVSGTSADSWQMSPELRFVPIPEQTVQFLGCTLTFPASVGPPRNNAELLTQLHAAAAAVAAQGPITHGVPLQAQANALLEIMASKGYYAKLEGEDDILPALTPAATTAASAGAGAAAGVLAAAGAAAIVVAGDEAQSVRPPSNGQDMSLTPGHADHGLHMRAAASFAAAAPAGHHVQGFTPPTCGHGGSLTPSQGGQRPQMHAGAAASAAADAGNQVPGFTPATYGQGGPVLPVLAGHGLQTHAAPATAAAAADDDAAAAPAAAGHRVQGFVAAYCLSLLVLPAAVTLQRRTG